MSQTKELEQTGLAHRGVFWIGHLEIRCFFLWFVTLLSFFRETAPRTIFQRVLDILKKSSHTVELACRGPCQGEHLAASLQLITECFRCLRNACIECSVNQDSIR